MLHFEEAQSVQHTCHTYGTSSVEIAISRRVRTFCTPNGGEAKALAMHLKAVGAILYGAWWCPHCNHQKELFGNEASEALPYVECDRDDIGRKRCEAAQIKGYPTWDLNGERRLGVLSLEELEQWSRFSPQLKAAQP